MFICLNGYILHFVIYKTTDGTQNTCRYRRLNFSIHVNGGIKSSALKHEASGGGTKGVSQPDGLDI